MMATPIAICRNCARALDYRILLPYAALAKRAYSTKPPPSTSSPESSTPNPTTPRHDASPEPPHEQGAMSRRLEQATEDALLTSSPAGRQALADAGFSAELKERLFNKLADAQFRAEHGAAISAAGLDPTTMTKVPGSAATNTPAWTGEEAPADAVLRMLRDAHKPLPPGLRGKARLPTPVPVDMRLRRQAVVSPGRRAASAKERATAYSGLELGVKADKGLSDGEREAVKREFRERFTPGARAMPATLTGLASLANERIEDAIARGQFKDILRGKGVERDARADNPFIDTTEYIMNKMIKRQDIVPPWIEKQQELVKTAHAFRSRLRSDWRRHAARMIASRGGSLQSQMKQAAEYARAEEIHNPRRRNVDEISVPTSVTDDPVMVKVCEQQTATEKEREPSNDEGITLTRPFRDQDWQAIERSYMELAVNNLNKLTRSYNLICPDLAKKGYFSLERELDACFADVAPQIADTIKERAASPARSLTNTSGHGRTSLMDGFGGEGRTAVKVYDSKTPYYGLKEMWKDFWSRPA